MRLLDIRKLAIAFLAACGSTEPPPAPPSTPATPPVAPAPTPSLTGIWLGTIFPLHAPKSLRLQLHLDVAKSKCALDSLDQQVAAIPCTATVTGNALAIDIPAVHGTLKGTSTSDGDTINATFTQGAEMQVVLKRQATAIDPMSVGYDAARPALDNDLEKLKAVLDFDLTDALAKGDLAPETGNAVAIGVVAHGVRKIFTYGTAKPDSIFEIGSVTKTFTGLLLAQMVEQKKVKLDEPVRALMPKGTAPAPATGPEITLVDLSAQRSGLPRLPANLKPTDAVDPYAKYDAKMLYDAVKTQGLAAPAKPTFEYSNYGVGLLGQLLADRAGTTYEALLTKEITRPLGLKDTGITLAAPQQARLLPGHDGAHKAVPPWTWKALAGAGAIRSTPGDMLTYLEAQLHPDKLPAATTPEGKTLPAAITASHAVQSEAGKTEHIALNWFRIDETGSYWHNGATSGFSSFVHFNVDRDYAVVVLTSTTITHHSFADDLGHHVIERLTGRAAVTLAPPPPPAK